MIIFVKIFTSPAVFPHTWFKNQEGSKSQFSNVSMLPHTKNRRKLCPGFKIKSRARISKI